MSVHPAMIRGDGHHTFCVESESESFWPSLLKISYVHTNYYLCTNTGFSPCPSPAVDAFYHPSEPIGLAFHIELFVLSLSKSRPLKVNKSYRGSSPPASD